MKADPYVPALRFHWLTRLYDPILRTTLKEEKFKRMLVQQAGLEPGQRVLDLGCGTATLTVMLKQTCPQATVAFIGLQVLDGFGPTSDNVHGRLIPLMLEVAWSEWPKRTER